MSKRRSVPAKGPNQPARATARRPAPAPAKAPASRRPSGAAATRAVIAVVAVLAFVAATGLARAAHPSHVRHKAASLTAPASFIDQVRQAQIDAGKVSEAQGPGAPVTATS